MSALSEYLYDNLIIPNYYSENIMAFAESEFALDYVFEKVKEIA